MITGQTKSAPRVLLVDDDAPLLEELREGLDMLDLPVRTASTAKEALDLMERHDEPEKALRMHAVDFLQKPLIAEEDTQANGRAQTQKEDDSAGMASAPPAP